jgi:hypothetical protein
MISKPQPGVKKNIARRVAGNRPGNISAKAANNTAYQG